MIILIFRQKRKPSHALRTPEKVSCVKFYANFLFHMTRFYYSRFFYNKENFSGINFKFYESKIFVFRMKRVYG